MRKVRDLDRRAGRHRLPRRIPRRTVHLVLGAAVVLVGRAPAVGAAASQADPTTPAVTEVPAAVPSTTAVATTGSTDVAVVPPVGRSDAEQPLTDSERASRTLRLVAIALVALAAVVLVASIAFWRRTNPGRLMAKEAAQTGAVRRVVRIDSSSWSTEPNWAEGARVPAPEAPSAAPAVPRAAPVPAASAHPHGLWASSGWDEPAEPPPRS